MEEELNWEEFVLFMDKVYISVFEPPVSHQVQMKYNFNHGHIAFGTWEDAFSGKRLQELQEDILWKDCVCCYFSFFIFHFSFFIFSR